MGGLLSSLFSEEDQGAAPRPGRRVAPITAQDRAVLELKTQRDQLKRYIARVRVQPGARGRWAAPRTAAPASRCPRTPVPALRLPHLTCSAF